MLPKLHVFKHLVVNCTLLVGALLICLGGLEATVRALHLTPDVFLQEDARTGVWHIPNKHGVYFRKDIPRTVVNINADGLRDHHYPLHKPENTYRIAILGDSFTQAIHVPLEDTYQQRMEHLLNEQQVFLAESVEVINFGIGGFGTAQEYAVFTHRMLKYQPDMVILGFMLGNDIFENSPILNGRQYLPYFTLNDDGTLNAVSPGPVPLYMKLGASFKLIPLLYYRLVDGNAPLEKLLRGIRREVSKNTGIPLQYKIYDTQWDTTWENAWKLTHRLLVQLYQETVVRNITFLVVAIPDHIQVDPDFQKEVLAAYPAMQQRTWEWKKPATLLGQACQTSNIPLFDLSPVLSKQVQQDKGPFYYHDDGHWNALGHQLAAEQIVHFLVEVF